MECHYCLDCQMTYFADHICLSLYVEHRDLHSFPTRRSSDLVREAAEQLRLGVALRCADVDEAQSYTDRKSTRLNSSHVESSYAVFCLKKKNATTAWIAT